MPVSHLGLTVSRIPAATSFYLATLAPLGYRYVGSSGDSVGLGVDQADLFLTQEPHGQTVSPTHVAFAADSRLTVRNCYAAALSSGAHPSGAPSYRDRDCTVFNAAVEDLDGNVIEFVYRQEVEPEPEEHQSVEAPQDSRVLSWQQSVANSGLHDDQRSLDSRTSRARSRADTVRDLVSSASRSVRSQSEAPTPGLTRARTLPTAEFPSKAMLGTMLGATAGAALAWAMMQSEGKSARDEAAFATSTRSRSSTRQSSHDMNTHRNYSTTESHAPKTHRSQSVTESARSRNYPPRSLARAMGSSRRAIEQGPSNYDGEVDEVISRYTTSRRPTPLQRSKTIDAIEYAPMSRSGRESRYTAKRSTTLPYAEPVVYTEVAGSTRSTARYTTASHRGTREPAFDERDEATETAANEHTSRHTSGSRRSPRNLVQDEDLDLKRRDSGISMGSHRSHRSRHSTTDDDRRSSASTLKAARRGSSHHEPAPGPPVSSKLPSHVSSARAQSYVTAAQVPIPRSQQGTGYAEDSADESDGLGDAKTVVPEDSISCVDFSKPRSTARSSHTRSKHTSKASEAGSDRTVRQAKGSTSRHSAATLPAMPVEHRHSSNGRKKSTVSYA
ncbi:hypothetical protein LTR15_006058 [Elasticomyces elasticus]|nr:hypothetical protein LTR15_006058 [Elasticomyces elasticus]